jgi:hypothetical protein
MLSEVSTSCLRGERLVGEVLKRLGDLDSIINLARADKTLCIANIGGGELGRSTSNRLGKVREVFGAKSGDGAIVDTSRR